ncbi:hypothetical protein HZA43_00455 [Candidatus Peregrinibacteria bacterium]|nr:hypothetical protein [Candidatus Peregrinibacteria bacterium]
MRFRKVVLSLSFLPSNEERLRENGVIDAAERASTRIIERSRLSYDMPININPIDVKCVGRARQGKKDPVLRAGFNCSDMTFIDPVNGPCCNEYHISSTLFPTERNAFPVNQKRRVYPRNPFSIMRSPLGFIEGPTLYMPYSNYIDLDTGQFHTEVSLRHVAAYLFFLIRNYDNDSHFHNGFFQYWGFVVKALDQHEFVLPEDADELVFYQTIIRDLMKMLEARVSSDTAPLNIAMNGDFHRYRELFEQIKAAVSRIPGYTHS